MLVRAQVAVAINHFLLYPGEVRDVPAGVVAQVLARRPGALVSVGVLECGGVGETEDGSVGEAKQTPLVVQELTEPKPARKRRAAR